MAIPDSFPDSVRVTESTQDGSHAHHVEALVAAESDNDGPDGGRRRRGHVSEAEVLPERVVVLSEAAPETADAGGHTQRRTVESFKDFAENVEVVVYGKLGSF